jgi:hypothetical protein
MSIEELLSNISLLLIVSDAMLVVTIYLMYKLKKNIYGVMVNLLELTKMQHDVTVGIYERVDWFAQKELDKQPKQPIQPRPAVQEPQAVQAMQKDTGLSPEEERMIAQMRKPQPQPTNAGRFGFRPR